MATRAGIVGAGLAGRLLGLALLERGWDVTLYDRDRRAGRGSCTWASAGMIAPISELETAELEISRLGQRSLEIWERIVSDLPDDVFYRRDGSLIVAHPTDLPELDRLHRRVRSVRAQPHGLETVDGSGIDALEPQLGDRFGRGLFAPDEAQIDNRQALRALGNALTVAGADWRTETRVAGLGPGFVQVGGATERFDWVADTRGLGARQDLPDLRGVRGELIIVSAPDVQLRRPIRLMHPRYAVYVVPRPEGRYVVGATSIEAEDYSPISVRSALELLSAAFAVHPGFAEGRVEELVTQCRPAFPDHLPRVLCSDGLVRINGLYRHGFLLAPALTELAVGFMEDGRLRAGARGILVAA